MALTESKRSTLGSEAPEFTLPGVDGKEHSLASFSDAKILVVVFMCNHCPYVIAVQERINQLAKEYGPQGVRLIGINSNDVANYPDDSFEKMKIRAREQGYVFPYVLDESQSVARAFDAACTPDPYVYEKLNGKFVLRYHGRIDDHWKDPAAVTQRELALSIDAILAGRPVATDQKPSLGCNIKWRKSP